MDKKGFNPDKAKKKPNTDVPITGAIGCLHFAKNPDNGKPELFVGYENGAIGGFRVSFDAIFGKLSF